MRYALGQSDDSTTTDLTAITGAIASSAPAIITGLTQAELAQSQISAANSINAINIQRAQQGLPPINVNLASTAPTVNVGLSPELTAYVPYIVFGLLGIIGLRMLTK